MLDGLHGKSQSQLLDEISDRTHLSKLHLISFLAMGMGKSLARGCMSESGSRHH